MKIISYNISRYCQEKLDSTLFHEADIYILPELACPEMVSLPNGYKMEWMGDYDFKGLGIVWKAGLKAEVPKWFQPDHADILRASFQRGKNLSISAWKRALWLGSNRWQSS